MSESKSEFLLLFRGPEWADRLPLDELQRLMDDMTTWMNRMIAEGRVKGGQPLGHEGRLVSGAAGPRAVDGPFVESKETVGGFMTVRATNLDEAVAIAKGYPGLQHGIRVEVRPLLEECPCFQRAKQRLGMEWTATTCK